MTHDITAKLTFVTAVEKRTRQRPPRLPCLFDVLLLLLLWLFDVVFIRLMWMWVLFGDVVFIQLLLFVDVVVMRMLMLLLVVKVVHRLNNNVTARHADAAPTRGEKRVGHEILLSAERERRH